MDVKHHSLGTKNMRLSPLQMQVKENLTLLTDATDGLKALDFFIGEKDYQSLRTAMRRPPIVYLRTSARKVIVNMDNEIEAKKVGSSAGRAPGATVQDSTA